MQTIELVYYIFKIKCMLVVKSLSIQTWIILASIKLNVKLFITDQDLNFINFSNSNQVTPKEPFFEVDGQKVIYMFDPLFD